MTQRGRGLGGVRAYIVIQNERNKIKILLRSERGCAIILLAAFVFVYGIRKYRLQFQCMKCVIQCKNFCFGSVSLILDTVIFHMDTECSFSIGYILENNLVDGFFP